MCRLHGKQNYLKPENDLKDADENIIVEIFFTEQKKIKSGGKRDIRCKRNEGDKTIKTTQKKNDDQCFQEGVDVEEKKISGQKRHGQNTANPNLRR